MSESQDEVDPDVGEDEDEEGDDDRDVDKDTLKFWPMFCPHFSSEEGHEIVVNQAGKFTRKQKIFKSLKILTR